MKKGIQKIISVLVLYVLIMSIVSCAPFNQTQASEKPLITVTYSVLGSLVQELVGDTATVNVLVPNGQNLHEWKPSAKDIETLMKSDVIVQNGFNLEEGLIYPIEEAKASGVTVITAAEYVANPLTGGHHHDHGDVENEEDDHEDYGHEGDEPDEAAAYDPHIWMDPLTMKEAMTGIAAALETAINQDLSASLKQLETKLDTLDSDINSHVASLPEQDRLLITGHESMGYYAHRYGFRVIGTVIPGLSTHVEVAAKSLSELKTLINDNNFKAIFIELGNQKSVVDSLAAETGVKLVELNTHILPEDGSYFTFMRELTETIVDSLKD